MVRKKVEGNEDQRRAAARQARREGEAPSAQKETTGASKQRTHRPRHESHEDKVAAIHQGKQGWQKDTKAGNSQQGPGYEQDKRFTAHEDYTDEHGYSAPSPTPSRHTTARRSTWTRSRGAAACPARRPARCCTTWPPCTA